MNDSQVKIRLIVSSLIVILVLLDFTTLSEKIDAFEKVYNRYVKAEKPQTEVFDEIIIGGTTAGVRG